MPEVGRQGHVHRNGDRMGVDLPAALGGDGRAASEAHALLRQQVQREVQRRALVEESRWNNLHIDTNKWAEVPPHRADDEQHIKCV